MRRVDRQVKTVSHLFIRSSYGYASSFIIVLSISLALLGVRSIQAEYLKSLDPNQPDLLALRSEIAANLKSAARDLPPNKPIRFVEYKVKEGENFFTVVTKTSQDPDTLASLNGLINPNEVLPGAVILIPNARGLFRKTPTKPNEKKDSSNRKVRRGILTNAPRLGEFTFYLGGKYDLQERAYFEGRGFINPLIESKQSSGFGMRINPFTQKATFHGGLDLAAPNGTTVHASRDGRVVRAGWAKGYGNLIVIEHEFGYQTWYGHLSQIDTKVGASVNQTDSIGKVGSTGLSTGPHLHFELRKKGKKIRPHFGTIEDTENVGNAANTASTTD